MKLALIAALAALSIAPLSAAIIGEYPLYEFVPHSGFVDGSPITGSLIGDVQADVFLSSTLTVGAPFGPIEFTNIVFSGVPAGFSWYTVIIEDATATHALTLSFLNFNSIANLQLTPLLTNQGGPQRPSQIFNVSTGDTELLFAPGYIERLNPGVPEPSTWALCIGALAGIFVRNRRRSA